MKIAHICVRNFRSIGKIDLPVQSLTTIIGRNNAGKSNLLRSISTFATASDKALQDLDICRFRKADEETYIECKFSDLSKNERATFRKYVSADGSVTIRRTIETESGRTSSKLRGWCEIPTNEWLSESFSEYGRKSTWDSLGIGFFEYVDGKSEGRINKSDFESFRENFIERHASELKFERRLSETELLGRASTAVSSLPSVTLVPAVGDVSKEIVGSATSLLNIIAEELLSLASEEPNFKTASAALQDAAKLVNRGSSRLPIFDRLEGQLSEQLKGWGHIDCHLQTDVPELSRILLANLNLAINDGALTDVGQKGHGIQRQILFQLFG